MLESVENGRKQAIEAVRKFVTARIEFFRNVVPSAGQAGSKHGE
ncbi:hypothetical protein U8D42_12445 [Mycobacterium europaeum]|nr:hypothetical protein [Mycobacterium europaeum]MEA1162869.1 hypothetical protein [Mycobacterium europaeum]